MRATSRIPDCNFRFIVICLFTNIPVDYTINLILDELFDNDKDFVLEGKFLYYTLIDIGTHNGS